MSPEQPQNKDMKDGTSNSSEPSKPTTKKRGRPPKAKVVAKNEDVAPAIKGAVPPDHVLTSIGQLDQRVTVAAASGTGEILVTTDVLKALLLGKYKDDAYIVYHNVFLHDWTRVDETKLLEHQSIHEKVFGNSKVSIGNGAIQNAGAVKGSQK